MSRSVDRAVLRFAARRQNVLTTPQLAELGVSRHAIARHVRAGQLHRRYHGVYAVGRRDLTPDGERLAAVLALGATAVLSHTSAAMKWDLLDGALFPLHVALPGSGRAHRARIRVHRTSTLHREDTLVLDAIPITSVERALLDLAAAVPARRLLRAVEQAERLRRLDLAGLDRVLQRNPRAPGAAALMTILAAYTTAPDTKSRLERDFLELVDAYGLPRPQLNVKVAGCIVDAFWPQWRLVVELDSILWHLTRRGFQTDRVRDARLQRDRQRVLRITDERMKLEPDAVHDDIRALAALA